MEEAQKVPILNEQPGEKTLAGHGEQKRKTEKELRLPKEEQSLQMKPNSVNPEAPNKRLKTTQKQFTLVRRLGAFYGSQYWSF